MKLEFKKLGDIATYINGYAFKPTDWGQNGKAIIRIQNLNNDNAEFNYFSGDINEKYIVKKGDILISWSASIGVYEWNKEDALLNQHIFKVNFNKEEINKIYFKHMVSIALNKAIQFMHGSTMKHITKKYFDDIKIPVPSLEIQKNIADILDKAKSLASKRKEQIEELDLLVKSKFIEMFGDPVLNSKGWQKGKIADIIVKTQYGTSNKADEFNGDFKVLRMNNITYDGNWDFTSIKYVNLDEKEQKKYLVYKGEVLFNRTNSKELVGKTAVYKEDEPMAYAGYLVKAIPNERANGEFISAYMNTKYVKDKLLNMAKNIVGMANINAEEFKKIDVYIPPIELQNQFAEFVKQVDKLKFELEKSLKELEDNFNSLMQKAFKGELFN
ncbi:type I restriction endonuclease subunit S [Clostridium perfringens]|nr:type I restriction endonuclease subunit S [Clostridium perfringens]